MKVILSKIGTHWHKDPKCRFVTDMDIPRDHYIEIPENLWSWVGNILVFPVRLDNGISKEHWYRPCPSCAK